MKPVSPRAHLPTDERISHTADPDPSSSREAAVFTMATRRSSFKPNWHFKRSSIAAATSVFVALTVHAQDAATLSTITVNDQTAAPMADVTGFGDVPLLEVPLSVTVVGHTELQNVGARRLADLTQFDASVADAYNSPGYWDFLSVRGFTLDNRFNYRREGLSISAETSIPLENKERIEILKGTSGIQAGTSAPGGLVNYVVKRPTEHDLREINVEWTGRGSLLTAVDLGGRFGAERQFGYRLNVAAEKLRPETYNVDGSRNLFALAADWRLTRDTVLEVEFENSHKSQPSVAGTSVIGNQLPPQPNPRLNLNNQPWSQPSVFDAFTGTVRLQQAINTDWRWSAQVGQQRLKTDDHLAYPFGCSAENVYDRFCSDGTFDMYDFRSDNERRTQTGANLRLQGNVTTGSVKHDLGIGLTSSRVRNRFEEYAYNPVGIGTIDGQTVLPADPSLFVGNTNRDERSLEFALQDAIHWTPEFTTWVGLRHTRLQRDSALTDGSNPTSYSDSLNTPWLAASYKLPNAAVVYASYGEGLESSVMPNNPAIGFTNAGQALPAAKSKQFEVGVKGGSENLGWQLAAFQIKRPISNVDACTRLFVVDCPAGYDGDAVHRGLEASSQWRSGPWALDGSATLLHARREGSTLEPQNNGKRPTNVPDWALRARVAYNLTAVPGMQIEGLLSHEGQRAVTADESIMLGAWTRVDATLRYNTKLGATNTTWILGVDNLFDKTYFQESPTQFGHIYLFSGAPRTFRIGFRVSL